MSMKTVYSHIFISTVALLLCGCSVTRDIPEGSYLLDDVKVVADGKYRDIKLTYRGRILQVYLTLRDQGSNESVPEWVKQDAQEKLEKYLVRAESSD